MSKANTNNKPNNQPNKWPRVTVILIASLISTLVLLGLGALAAADSLWGVNHLWFLKQSHWIIFAITSFIITLMLLSPKTFGRLTLSDRIDQLFTILATRKSRLALALCAGIVFWILRIDTYLLGDGYAWLSIMGRGANYIHKWTEPGSTMVIRTLQLLFGGYTQATALLAFQVVSFLSGIIVCYHILGMSLIITVQRNLRALFLITLLGSGVTLLFLGYVEYYPILWAAATSFIYATLRYLERGKGLWLVILTFALSVLMHLQSMYYILAVLYLALDRLSLTFPKLRSRNIALGALSAAVLFGSLAFYWLHNNFLEFEVIFLPFFIGRSASPEYAVFSLAHIRDIGNLIFIIFPGILFLITLQFLPSPSSDYSSKQPLSKQSLSKQSSAKQSSAKKLSTQTIFFGLCSLGSITFLFLIDPVIGMARDWDLFSLTLLPPLILLFLSLKSIDTAKISPMLVPYALTCLLGTGLFLSTNVSTEASESRFLSILRGYGAKERTGWVIYSNYLKDKGYFESQKQVLVELAERFPEDKSLSKFYGLLKRNDYDSALKLARKLYHLDPYRGDFLQALGNVFRRLKVFDSSDFYFERAMTLRPHHSMLFNEYGQSLIAQNRLQEALQVLGRAHYYNPTNSAILEGLGLAYNNLGHTDSTLMISDSLFALDVNSPGGHLLKMVVSLQSGDRVTARGHFIEYKKFGSGRSDYKNILDYYGNLERAGD